MLDPASTQLKPRILCLSGNDPSGGAGIQADIETLQMHNCHCLPMITLNSAQDSKGVYAISETDPKLLEHQFELLKKDGAIAGIKVGMLASAEQIKYVSALIEKLPNVPLVVDPVFGSGLGTPIAKQNHIEAMRYHLLPLASLVTPNTYEASQLNTEHNAGTDNTFDDDSNAILSTGAKAVLITGTHEKNKDDINHRLYSQQILQEGITINQPQIFKVKRLSGNFHGSGCTLASAICANLVQGETLVDAVSNALYFTEQSLLKAQALGKHQLFPNRHAIKPSIT